MPSRPSRKSVVVLLSLALLLALPVGMESGATAGPARPSTAMRAEKPKRVMVYRIDYRGLAAHPVWGYYYSPTRHVIHRKGGKSQVVVGPARPHAGWRTVWTPTSWHHFRTVDDPAAVVQLSVALQARGLQTRVVRRMHRV